MTGMRRKTPARQGAGGGKRAALAVCVMLGAAPASPTAAGQGPAASDSGLQLGRQVYERVCQECHGPEGRGNGPKARQMGFKPRDFALGAFKCRCTPSGELPSDADLLRVVSGGMPGTPMQAQGENLTAAEQMAVVQFIKTLAPRFATEVPPPCGDEPQAVRSSPDSVAEGRQVYRVLQCWKCHGITGRGDGPAKDLVDDWGQPIKPYNFTILKKFKCGNDDADLYRTLHTGMNGSPMPSFTSAFLFARDDVPDPAAAAGPAGEQGAGELAEYLRRQPAAAALRVMSKADRQRLIEVRSWALVHYLRSLLSRPR